MSRFVVRQEADRLANRKLIITSIGSIVVFGVAVAISSWLLDATRRPVDTHLPAPSAAPMTIGTVEQGLLLGPARGLDLRRDQRASLDRWGWVDRDAGIARIPVERAMELVAAEPAGAGQHGDGGTP